MKRFSFLSLLILPLFCWSQEIVYRSFEAAGGSPSYINFSPLTAKRTYGNISQDYGNYFRVYTFQQIDVMHAEQKGRLEELRTYVTVNNQKQDSTYNKALMDSVALIKSQIKLEVIDELTTSLKAAFRIELDKLREDMQKQIDELKNKVK